MTARRFASFALIASLAPKAAGAQHASAPAAAPHAGLEAKTTAAKPTASKPVASTIAEPAPPAKAPLDAAAAASDIKAALERIDQQIARGRAASRSPRIASKAPVPPAPARIRLSWRSSLTWPVEIGGSGDIEHDEGSRITLNWP